jgi:hypothetical protein
MYNKGKYLVGQVAGTYSDQVVAIVFPETLGHDDIGRKVFIAGTVIGGGFFWFDADNNVVVSDKSVSMGVQSRPEDVVYLGRALGIIGD